MTELDLVYWGIGNPAPWNALLRKGDNLYTNTIIAVQRRPANWSGISRWSPNDPFDHDNITAIILAELTIEGKPTKVLLQAARNGFFYVIERKTGQLIAANPYVKVTWATHIDKETGRPEWTEPPRRRRLYGADRDLAAYHGGTNWFPSSFNPMTGLSYVNTADYGMKYQPDPVEEIRNLKPGDSHRAVKITADLQCGRKPRHLRAIDPMTGKSKWSIRSRARTGPARWLRRADSCSPASSRRIHRRGQRYRQDPLAVPDPSGIIGQRSHGSVTQAICDRHQRHRRRLCAENAGSQPDPCCRRAHVVDLQADGSVTACLPRRGRPCGRPLFARMRLLKARIGPGGALVHAARTLAPRGRRRSGGPDRGEDL